MERGVHGVSSRHATNHVEKESRCVSEPVLTPLRLLVDNRVWGFLTDRFLQHKNLSQWVDLLWVLRKLRSNTGRTLSSFLFYRNGCTYPFITWILNVKSTNFICCLIVHLFRAIRCSNIDQNLGNLSSWFYYA